MHRVDGRRLGVGRDRPALPAISAIDLSHGAGQLGCSSTSNAARAQMRAGRREINSSQPDMDAEVLFHEQPFVWVGPHSKWLGRRKIGLAELVDEPWILTSFDIQPGAPVFEAF